MGNDEQVASQVGLHLLAELADRSGLSAAYSAAMSECAVRAPMHDRGRLLAQVAVMLAGGGECMADMAALRDQPALFGDVASDPTIWRVLTNISTETLSNLRAARAEARATAWARAGTPEEIVLDVDAALVEIHSDNKEGAASNFKGGFGFQPMFCFLDDSGEALAGILRPGNATANSGADQLAVVDLALDQLPAECCAGHRPGDDRSEVGHPVLVRADTAGAVHSFLSGLVARNCEFSVGARVNPQLSEAIATVPARAWRPALDATGEVRPGAFVAELTVALEGWPEGTRAICRRERPHPGAQLRLWDIGGLRHQVVLTNSAGDAVELERRHRRHAEVENCIKRLRACGLDRMPFGAFAANAVWLELALGAADLLAWLQLCCLEGELAYAEPKALRYRLLHVAARVVRRARRVILRLPRHWPWADELATAYRRVAALGP
jgi:hypothetical protein